MVQDPLLFGGAGDFNEFSHQLGFTTRGRSGREMRSTVINPAAGVGRHCLNLHFPKIVLDCKAAHEQYNYVHSEAKKEIPTNFS
jgi:hypothetical protein